MNFPIELYCGGKKSVVPTGKDNFRYDAYISYSDNESDASCVWQTIIPRLEAAGLRLAVSGDSDEPGVPHVVNIERGIRQAKRSLVVLSEAYFADYKQNFDSII